MSIPTPAPPAPPDEERIAELLGGFQPQPGEQFHRRMASAPWVAAASQSPLGWRRTVRGLGFAALGLLILLAVVFYTPPLRGMAQNLFQFFIHAESDEIAVNLGTPQPTDERFPLTLGEAERLAGFHIKVPHYLPSGYTFHGVAYDPETETITLEYTSPIPGRMLRLSQTQVGEARISLGNIGVSAFVKRVQVGAEIGEYVVGAWRIPPMATAIEHSQPGLTVTLQASWDPTAKIHMLRWQEGEILFEIMHADKNPDNLRQQELITMAESMK